MKDWIYVCVLALLSQVVFAQGRFDNVTIKTTKVTGHVYMLQGAGGNIGVSAGDDGVFVIDDQFAPLTAKIQAAIKEINDQPARFVLNTHWHGDHTGGNENFGKAGALIVAHENVRVRMSTKQFMKAFNREVPPSPKMAWPVVTFTRDMTFHLNGDNIRVFHVAHAHTDGDAIIHFEKANVVHMGDVHFNGFYPFIDTGSGGSIKGMIAAVDQVLAKIDDNTKVIPGHGPLSNKAELTQYRDMLKGVAQSIDKLVAAGKTLDEALAAKPTTAFDEVWGGGFMKPDRFTEIVFNDLNKK